MRKSLLRLGFLALGIGVSPLAFSQSDIQAGMWQLSVEFSVPDDPGFKQAPISRNQCVTDADGRDPARLLNGAANPGASACAFSDKSGAGGHLEFTVKCEGIFGIGGRGSFDYTPTSMQGTLNLDFQLSGGEAKRTGSVSRLTGRRIGDC